MAHSRSPATIPASLVTALRDVRGFVDELRNRHGRATFELDDAGLPVLDEVVFTEQCADGESVESFLVRVWVNHKPLPHAQIEFSSHGGRLTARITSRPHSDEHDLAAEIAQLRHQVAALAAHLEG